MKLYSIKTGEEWEGEPIDARVMLERGGWTEDYIPVILTRKEPVVENKKQPPAKRKGRKKE